MEIYRGIMKNDPRRRWRGSTSTAINRVFDVSSKLYLDIGRSIGSACSLHRISRAERTLPVYRSTPRYQHTPRDKHTLVVWRDFFSFSFFFWIWNVYLLIIFRKKGENRFFFVQLWLGLRIFSDDDVRLRMLLMIILAGVVVMQLWNIDYTFKIYIMFFVWVWERYW